MRIFGSAQVPGRELGLGDGVGGRLADRQRVNGGAPRMHAAGGRPRHCGVAGVEVGGAGVPGGAVDDAPAVVDQASSFTTSELGFSPVRLVEVIA